jgi:cytochrome c biogenesis protein CcdA
MIELLVEGVESLRLPCSWVLLIPGVAIMVFGRRRTPLVLAAFVSVAMLVVWFRLAGWWFETPSGIVQIILGIAIMGAAALAWKHDRGLTDVAAAAVAGAAGAWTWIPCVGPNLSEVLNGSRTNAYEHIGGTIAFLAGQFLPFILITAVGVLFPTIHEKLSNRTVITVGAVLLGLVGLLFATTLFDEFTSELARRNTL